MGRQHHLAKRENQLKLIGKNLSDVVSEIQDSFRKRTFIFKQDGTKTSHILDDDYAIDCFFGSDERLEDAVITKVEMNLSTRIFSFQYRLP